jgi:hypothetical protein
MPEGCLPYEGYFNASNECWAVFCEVLEAEFSDAVLFGRAHQLTVDAYAVQHAGGQHPDKSVAVHLSGLYLALERGLALPQIAPRMQAIAEHVERWPHFELPARRAKLTIFDVAAVAGSRDHDTRVREWAREVWSSWSAHHHAIADFVHTALSADEGHLARRS